MDKNELKFKPAWWLPGPHLQTLWPALCRRAIKNLVLERERFELPDGDFIDLDWVGKTNTGPIILILHGLEGSIHSHYAKGMLHAVTQENWRGVFMHFRGCSGEHNRLPRSYHSGDTGDLATILQTLYKREPQTSFAAIGFSLGGNVLLKWLGETGKNNFLKAAVAVSVPFELHKITERIQHGFSRLYQWHLMKCLRKRLMHKFQYCCPPPAIDLSLLSSLKKLRDFDDHITAPLHGFFNALEYYARSSSRQYLTNIHVPTLLLHAKDDPFMTQDVIPTRDQLPDQVKIELTESGGHVGFVAGNFPWNALYWLEQRVPLYLKQYL
jgi:uncharacterized protein